MISYYVISVTLLNFIFMDLQSSHDTSYIVMMREVFVVTKQSHRRQQVTLSSECSECLLFNFNELLKLYSYPIISLHI